MTSQQGMLPNSTRRAEEQWLNFALRQVARAAPHPDPASLQHTGTALGYRLRLSFLESLPLFQAEDRNFDVRLGVTLFDEAAGCFFGPTAHTAPVEYDMRRSKGRRGFHLDLDCSLYLHSRAAMAGKHPPSDSTSALPSGRSSSGAGLLAVVEIVLVDSGLDGVVAGEYSAGWCGIPLELSSAASGFTNGGANTSALGPSRSMQHVVPLRPGSPDKVAGVGLGSTLCCMGGGRAPNPPWFLAGSGLKAADTSSSSCRQAPLRQGLMAAQLGAGGQLCVPVLMGSPRYLLLHQMLPAAQRRPPAQLLADGAECRLHYQFELCPEAATWAPLVPENFLISSQDVVPGLERRSPLACHNESSSSSRGRGGSSDRCASRLPAGVPTLGVLGAATQLAPPRLAELHAVVVVGLSVHLPDGFLEVARKQAAYLWRQAGGAAQPQAAGRAAGGYGGRAVPSLPELQQGLALRVSVHNGRRFVGPAAVCGVAAIEPVEGRRGEHRLLAAQDAPLAWLPADRFVVLVLELLLRQPSRHHPSRDADSSGSGNSSDQQDHMEEGQGPVRVLGWAAAVPFLKDSGDGGKEQQLVVAEGQHHVSLRGGPGRWLRSIPVLDWRRLIEITNRVSPAAPTVSFVLQQASGQAVWPPPAVPVPLQASPPEPAGYMQKERHLRASRPAMAAAPQPAEVQLPQSPTAASEADTLLSVPAQHPTASAPAAVAAELQKRLPQLRAVRTRAGQSLPAPSKEEAAALYSGSPTAKLAGRLGRDAFGGAATAVEAAVAAAAVAAAPVVPALSELELSRLLQAELEDQLISNQASMQLLAFEAACVATGADNEAAAPSSLHFTFRFFDSQQPTVTAPLQLEVVPGTSYVLADGQLFALASAEGSASEVSDSMQQPAPAPLLQLQLLDAAAMARQLQLLAEQGVPQAAVASAARQQRLRAAQYLAERQLQIDVWDSSSKLQVGSLSVPLRCLLRQGLPRAEAVLRVAVLDPAAAVTRQGSSGIGVRLCSAPLRGCILLRLSCRGQKLDLPGICGSGSWPVSPSSPLKAAAGQRVVVTAVPALEEGGGLALELARQQGVPLSGSPQHLREGIVTKAATKVHRLLHFKSLAAGAGGGLNSGPGSVQGSPYSTRCSSTTGQWPAPQHEGQQQLQGTSAMEADENASAERLVEREVLGEVAAARERCKRDTILRQLQAQLPSCAAVCVAPGDAVAFERQFVNNSNEDAWFELSFGSGCNDGSATRNTGSNGGVSLSLAADEWEWRGLARAAELAGLASPNSSTSGLKAISSPRFRLAPHEACLLRFKVSRPLAGPDAGQHQEQQQSCSNSCELSWHHISISRVAGAHSANLPENLAAASAAPEFAAAYQLPVLLLAAPVIHRTLRLYSPAAGSGGGASGPAVYSLQLASLPGSGGLLAAGGAVACMASSPGVRASVADGCLLLSCPPPPPGIASQFLLSLHSASAVAKSSGRGSFAATPSEVWEVFLHGLPALQLSAPVGGSASASWRLPASLAAVPCSGRHGCVACSWRGCGHAELQVDEAGSSSGCLALRFSPAAIRRSELLLSVAGQSPDRSGWQPRQAELLLLRLDSSATQVSRTFEVQLHPGPTVSKKVRYTSPYLQPRLIAVRSMAPAAVRISASSSEFVLEGRGTCSIKMHLSGGAVFSAAADSGGAAAGRHGQAPAQQEVLVVVESSGLGEGDGSGEGTWQVEEVFRLVLTVRR